MSVQHEDQIEIATKKAFDDAWWNKFLQDTKGMTVPVYYKGTIADEMTFYKERLLRIFSDPDKYDNSYRIWIEKFQRDDLNYYLKAFPPEKEEDIEEWLYRIFEGLKVGIIFNGLESYDKKLAVHIHQLLSPLLSKIGYPLKGIELTLVVGNYGNTPLGIHQDLPGESVLHLHMGPGKKTMYLWSEENYAKLIKDPGVGNDLAVLKERADHVVTYQAGDVFYMPWHYFHIGESNDFSITLTVWINRPTRGKMLDVVATYMSRQILEEVFALNDNTISSIIDPQHNILDFDLFESIKEGVRPPDQILPNVHSLIRQGAKEHLYILKSNLGFLGRLKEDAFAKKDLTDEDLIQLDIPFRMEFFEQDGDFHIFIRGRKVIYPVHDSIRVLLDRVNSGNIYLVKEILKGLFQDWPVDLQLEMGIRLLNRFYAKGGIRLVDASQT